MRQRWHDLLFCHWPVAPELLQPLVPEGLELETREGSAWLGIIPFRMSGIRFRYLPPIPGTSAFLEMNVRTYVTCNGLPGVWFFSLDAANRLAVKVARLWFHLPYFHARMELREEAGSFHYLSLRQGRLLRVRYQPEGEVRLAEPGSLNAWLTERYRLFARKPDGTILCAEVEHEPWPLQPASADIEENSMAPCPLPAAPPLLHFARDLDVRVAAPAPLKAHRTDGR